MSFDKKRLDHPQYFVTCKKKNVLRPQHRSKTFSF